MDRKSYIERLRRGLGGLAARGEIVADIDEHFMAGIAAGRSEAELAASLGSPESLAREFRASALARRSGDAPGLLRSLRLTAYGIADRMPAAAAVCVMATLGLGAAALILGALYAAARGFAEATGMLVPIAEGRAAVPPPPAAAILASLGFALAGLSGILGLALLVLRSGRKAGRYFIERGSRARRWPNE